MAANKWEEFYSLVRDMRKAQKEYIRGRKSADSTALLVRSVELERRVDAIIKEREERLIARKQGSLFNEQG